MDGGWDTEQKGRREGEESGREVGDKRRPRRIATGGLEVAEPESSIKPAPGRGCCIGQVPMIF